MKSTSKNLSKFFSGGAMASSASFWLRHCPRLRQLNLFRDFRKSLKMRKMNHFVLFCKSYLVQFLTLYVALILCCTITDLGIF